MLKDEGKPKKDWESEIARWESSGKTRAAYCREQGLKYELFQYYLRRLRPKIAPKLVAMPRMRMSASVSGEIIIRAGGYELVVGPGFDAETLSEVMRVVRQVN